MLMPKRTKHRKHHKGRIHGNAKRGHRLVFGEFGLKALEPERLDSRQIEAARRTMVRCLKRSGKVWIRVFPDISVSAKPAEVRMGSGKGSHDRWACRVRPGKILFELDGVSEELAIKAFALADSKLPIKTKLVKKLPCE